MEKIKKNRFSKVLVLLLAVMMIFTMMPSMAFAAEAAEAGNAAAPESLTVSLAEGQTLEDGTLIAKKGDTFRFTAKDQNGEPADVKWSTSSTWIGTLNEETGEFTVTNDMSSGGTSYLYITAVSKADAAISKNANFQMQGYTFAANYKNYTVALSADGQSVKTFNLSGGVNGHSIWSHTADEAVAVLTKEPGNGTSISFAAYRPGTFTVTVKLDLDEKLTDTANITITGVAVEDNSGRSQKTYLSINSSEKNPQMQLKAYCEAEKTITDWESSDESVAVVDQNGLVTAQGVGTALISATDSAGQKGGIKIVVQDEENPYFEDLQFLSNAIKDYNQNYRFKPNTLNYTLEIKSYSTSTLTLQNTTLYDTEKYTATAAYTNIDGEAKEVSVNSGKTTALAGIPFDESTITITIADKQETQKKTVYTFKVTRPRDTTKQIRAAGWGTTPGLVLKPEGRELLASKYKNQPEGTLFRADENGEATTGTGFSSSTYHYRTYLLQSEKSFKLELASSTAYAHIRYSVDEGETWKELPQGGGITDSILIPDTADDVKVNIQVLDDKTYTENKAAGKEGFEEGITTNYALWVESVKVTAVDAQILTAACGDGDWYPAFDRDKYSFSVAVPTGTTEKTLTYTITEGASVKLGNILQTPDSDGTYTLNLKTSAQTLTVTSADEKITNSYSFKLQVKKAAYPDKIVDYLCMGSQYTNGAYGIGPETTLSGSMKSLGNFGGYITYYYEDAIKNDPNHKYGIDFYVYGNSSEQNQGSMAELGQVYVSQDNKTWYALAGSEHYEDKAIWDYTIHYTKGADGKSYWTDNQGNKMANSAPKWPSAQYYYLNQVAEQDSYSYAGIVFKSQEDDTIMGSGTTASFAAAAKFGYADYYANGTLGADVNPYVANPTKSNGFDISWAVDENGEPVALDSIHYIKVATGSNIWAGAFNEKSTEVTAVLRTTAQSEAVGKTDAPDSITITDGASEKVIKLSEGQQVYKLDLDDMKYISIGVNGADAEDNIYVNNQRIPADQAAEGLKVTKEDGEKLVRVIVQNGDKEPVLYLLKLTSSAKQSDDLIDGVKVVAGGASRTAATKDGKTYTASVGYRINEVNLIPLAVPGTEILINDADNAGTYSLSEGVNTFIIKAKKDGKEQTVTLKITKEAAPIKQGTIKVSFTLLGDTEHGSNGKEHTLKKGGLTTWISPTVYEVASPATVLDVLEKALENKYSFTNEGGNYISEINGLAEFSNGTDSGWMYTLNGTHPDLGVAEQIVQGGDVIVFHYTDNYHAEEGSENWGASEEPKADDSEDADLTQVKEQLAKVSLTARSAKTAKKNVKVTLKMDAESAAAINEIQSLGYTVKYKFYRSTKKAAGYSAKLTKTSKSYINTSGTKGSRYYYKARVMVYDGSGKLVAFSKLTQCKYAARIWTKAK